MMARLLHGFLDVATTIDPYFLSEVVPRFSFSTAHPFVGEPSSKGRTMMNDVKTLFLHTSR